MALKRQEVIIEFNAETNEAVSSVEELEGSYGQLEQKIEDVANAQKKEAQVAKDRDKQRSKEADNITKAVDKIAAAEKKRAAIEKGGIAERDAGSSQYIGDLNEINNGLSKVTDGQTGFISTAINGFETLKQGISGATGGFSLMKTAIAATGIGLLVTAGVELVAFASDFIDAWSDKSAERSLEAMVESSKELVAEQEQSLKMLELQGAGQREILDKKQDIIRAQIRQAKKEQDLASEQENQEGILAAQNKQKQLAIDLTVIQAEKEQLLIDKLERYRRATDEAYDEQQQRLEDIGEEEERLQKLRETGPSRLLMLQDLFFRKGQDIYQRGFVKTFEDLGIIDITQENLDIFREQYLAGLKDFNKAISEEGYTPTVSLKAAREQFDRIFEDLKRGEKFQFVPGSEEEYRSAFAAQEAINEEIAQLEELIELYNLAQEQAEETTEVVTVQEEKRDAERIGRRGAFRTYEEEERKQLQVAREQLNKDIIIGEQLITQNFETESQKRQRIRQEEYELFRDFVLKDEETMLNAGKRGLEILTDLNEAFYGETEEQQKKGFDRAKRIQAAQTLINTYEATMAAYKSVVGTPFVGPALAPIVAATVAATGLKNVQNILNQQYEGSGPSPDTGRDPIRNVSGPSAPTIDLSFLGEGAGQAEPIRAYVLAENVSNAQQANQKILDQTTL